MPLRTCQAERGRWADGCGVCSAKLPPTTPHPKVSFCTALCKNSFDTSNTFLVCSPSSHAQISQTGPHTEHTWLDGFQFSTSHPHPQSPLCPCLFMKYFPLSCIFLCQTSPASNNPLGQCTDGLHPVHAPYQ